ncbi:cytochrome c oxidase subunit 5B, mitochondrial [Anabrus simplex]|uniref:cytochrome c oxidase subunit 5B, mitochondrial n=1 Tax=Anabrus simplex TaxID=316456 RepID=UPI0034DD4D1C
MAALCSRITFQISRRHFSRSSIRLADKMMPDPLEHATGLEKRELLARVAGNDNPFDMKILKRGLGTKDQPNSIPSAFDNRLIGCICEEDSTHINWMVLNKGEPTRCECGHWFKLVEKAPV